MTPSPQPAPSIPKGYVTFVKRVFGKLEYAPVCSVDTEERVRKKYCSAIADLAGLGFDHQSCYGEAFPLARFAFILPAIIVLLMWFERQPIMTKHCGAASIAEVWASHQLRIQALESAGRRVDRQISFSSDANMLHKETTLL